MLLSKKSIRTLGIIFTVISLILAIIAVILAGIFYNYAGPNFRPNPFHAIPETSIATIVFSFFVIVLCFIAFFKPNVKFTTVTAIILLLSLLFNFAIAIYTIVAASHGWVNTYGVGCSGEFQGVMGVFNHIDTYLQEVDQAKCSPTCPCFITNSTAFITNATTSEYYDLWTKSNTPGGAVAFQNCTLDLQTYVYNEAVRRDLSFSQIEEFDPIEFAEYFSRIEEDFECSGWCAIEYNNANYRRSVGIRKYLFTDVNRGPPVYFGCLNELITWLPSYLNAFGSMIMLLFGTQLMLFALLLCQIQTREKDHEKQIPHHHDDNQAMSEENVYVENCIEYDESDFNDILTEEALKAAQTQKKDENTDEGKRKEFDSADYWMKVQKEKENSENTNTDAK